MTLHGIVLKRRNAGESDRRLTLLTREAGKLDVVAKGARKGGSSLAGSSEPLLCAEFQVAAGRVNRFVTQVQPCTSFPGLRSDYDRLAMALALVELFEAVLPWDEVDPDAYELLEACLRALEAHAEPLVAYVWAQTALLGIAGFLPSFARCAVGETPIAEAEPWFSPGAGGYVAERHADRYPDGFRTRAEALMGLARIAQCLAPPEHLKFAPECLRVLLLVWQHTLERRLPALEAAYAAL